MGPLVLFAWSVVAAALRDAMPDRFGLAAHPPDLHVALAAWLALRAAGPRVVVWGIVLGLLVDCASLDPLGTHAFVLGTVTWLFSRRHDPLDARSFDRRSAVRGPTGALLPLCVALASVAASALYALRCLPMYGDVAALSGFVERLPAALTTALVSWPLLVVLDRTGALDDLTGHRRAARA